MEVKQERNSNFELLRIVSMFFIVLYHTIFHGYVRENVTNESLRVIFELIVFVIIVHVNSFVLVTGYFQSNSKFKQSKLWFLTNASLFYKILIVVILSLLGIINLTKIEVFKEFFILNLSEYWFVKNYLFLYCLSPFINKLIVSLNKKDYQKLLIVLTIILSIIPYITGNQAFDNTGYSLYSFIYLYLVGAYIRLYPVKDSYLFRICSKNLFRIITVLIFIGCIFLNFIIFKTCEALINTNSIFKEVSLNLLTMKNLYSNPIIILQSIAYFLFFDSFNIRNRIINVISKLTFGVYLIHDNNYLRLYIYKWLKINNEPISNYSFIFYVLGVALGIFLSCLLLEFLRQVVFKFIYRRKISIKIRKKYYDWLHTIRINSYK